MATYIEHPVTVLPETATLLEKALVDFYIARQKDVFEVEGEIPLRYLYDIENCPGNMLSYLACALSVEANTINFSDTQLRQLIRDSYNLHTRKGTIQALKDVIASLGYNLNRIEEGVEGHWAKYRLVMNTALTIANGRNLKKLIEDAAPVSRELVSLTYDTAHAYDGVIRYDGSYAYGRITV